MFELKFWYCLIRFSTAKVIFFLSLLIFIKLSNLPVKEDLEEFIKNKNQTRNHEMPLSGQKVKTR